MGEAAGATGSPPEGTSERPSGAGSEGSGTRSQRAGASSEGSGARSQRAGASSEGSEASSQRAGASSEGSEASSQRAGAGSEGSGARSQRAGASSEGARSRSRRSRQAQRRTDTKDPRRSRERALKILFQADVRGVEPVTTLQRLTDDPAARAMLDDADDLTSEQELLAQAEDDAAAGTTDRAAVRAASIDGFTRTLVLGVADHRQEVDELIARFARRWQIHRMPVVDRKVLRLATYELLHEDTSPAVVINEAVNLAKSLSTDDSGRYVNGVLESIRKHLAARSGGEEAPGPGEDADS
jgi:transcription antitermination protein NusB